MLRLIRRFTTSLQEQGVRKTVREGFKLSANRHVPAWLLELVRHRTADLSDIDEYCERQGGTTLRIGEPDCFELGPISFPSSITNTGVRDISQYPYGHQVRTEPLEVRVIPNVTVSSEYCVPTSPIGYIPEIGLSERNLAVGLILSGFQRVSPSETQLGGDKAYIDSAVVLDGPYSTNYYHWFRNYVPRLEGLSQLHMDPAIIIPRNPPAWLTESLKLLNADRYEIIERPTSPFLVGKYVNVQSRFESRSHESALPGHKALSASSYRWISDRMKCTVTDGEDSSNGTRIYISRSDASERRTLNEEGVMSTLGEYEFERYVLSELSLQEQIKLFDGADAIIGAHGAGLFNMIFAQNATVIELLGPKTSYESPDQFYIMSQSLGHNYGCLEADVRNRNLHVETAELSDICESTIGVKEAHQ